MKDARRGRHRPPLRRLVASLAIGLVGAAGWRPGGGHAEPLVALYDAFWAGLPAARIRLEFAETGARYRDGIAISSLGLPRLVTRFHGAAAAEGRLGPDGLAEPERYDAVYALRKRQDRRISMRFVAKDGATVAERGAGDTSRKPPLAEAYRRDAVDPLTAFERIREALRAALHEGRRSFTVPVYDGARRFDVRGQVLSNPGDNGSLQVALALRPIAGFKGESSDEGDPDDAPRPARLKLSNDARLLPLSFEVPIWSLPLVVRLDRLCSAQLPCAPAPYVPAGGLSRERGEAGSPDQARGGG
jgi:Protein of unknown function (DUF3108)